jgi:hypothetical protein
LADPLFFVVGNYGEHSVNISGQVQNLTAGSKEIQVIQRQGTYQVNDVSSFGECWIPEWLVRYSDPIRPLYLWLLITQGFQVRDGFCYGLNLKADLWAVTR